jgi:hypothetical protein
MDIKKPDSYAENKALLPYGDNVNAPVIKLENISSWKLAHSAKVNHQLETKFLELKQEYQKLVSEYRWNELVYNAKFAYEPVIGQTYHLYYDKSGEVFLSMISPNEWNKPYIGSFKLDSNNKWNKIEEI